MSAEEWRKHAQVLASQLAECAGLMSSVRTDRRLKDQFGEVFCGQTLDWCEGAKEIATKANALLEEHDAQIMEDR